MYREYLRLWLEHIKDQWADGKIVGELENAEASGKAQFLKDLIDIDYEDMSEFYISIGVKSDSHTEE
jgi:hypothetical protein